MQAPTILEGAEPFFFPGNDIGVLVCHGFTGTTQSMRPLGEALAGAGYTVIGPRLAGHGTSPADMARTTAADWIASVDAALATLRETCTQVFMVGLSMGGTLTLYTAAKHGDVLRGAVPINGVVQANSTDLGGLALDASMPATVPGIGSDIKKPGVVELAYKEVPVPALRQIYALIGVTHDLLPTVRCPVLVMQSREDHVVDPSNAPRIVRRLGSSRIDLRWLDDSYHVATLDNDLPLIVSETLAFIRGIAGR